MKDNKIVVLILIIFLILIGLCTFLYCMANPQEYPEFESEHQKQTYSNVFGEVYEIDYCTYVNEPEYRNGRYRTFICDENGTLLFVDYGYLRKVSNVFSIGSLDNQEIYILTFLSDEYIVWKDWNGGLIINYYDMSEDEINNAENKVLFSYCIENKYAICERMESAGQSTAKFCEFINILENEY